jgi:putative flavoprotein involved in K+ transport
MTRREVVELLETYASRNSAPVFEGVTVAGLAGRPDSRLALRTSAGEFVAKAVVVCTGAFQRPHRPAIAAGLPVTVRVMDAGEYRNPGEIEPGGVLIVGSGQTGCQLAEELQLAGLRVVLACGRAPWFPRRMDGIDTLAWLRDTTYFELPLSALPSPVDRLLSNPQATGIDGGHDLHFRTLQALGVQLTGRLVAVDAERFAFADDLNASVAFGDARYEEIRTLLATQLQARGLRVPEMPVPAPFRSTQRDSVAVRDISTVIFTSGFRPAYTDWVEFPVFDGLGFPITTDGATLVPGLFFCGVHFLRKRKSGFLSGVGDDATIVADSVSRFVRSSQPAQ